jgi:PBS lyase HEAT-like repeat
MASARAKAGLTGGVRSGGRSVPSSVGKTNTRSRSATACLAGLFLLTLSGCPKDPYEADTWIDKLDEPSTADVLKAVDRLAELQDPKAIAPLGAAWEKHNRSPRILRVIIRLADQPANPRYPGGPFWGDAVPVLSKAVSEFKLGDSRSVEDAMIAADALGRAKDRSTAQVLIAAVNKTHNGKPLPITDLSQNVRIAAMRALGNFGSDDRVVDTLVKVLRTDPLTEENRNNVEAQRAAALVRGAAANALGATRSPRALQPLILSLFEVEVIFPQVRGALTRLGQPAVAELVRVFKGQHDEVNKFASANNFATDCSRGEGPNTRCVAPGALQYKSAIVLGDLRARDAVPILSAQLQKPSRTAFFEPKGVPGPPDHHGVLDALRKIGDASAADAVLSYLKDPQTDDLTRPIAIDVYSMITRDTKALDHLAAEMKNDAQEVEEIRRSAGLAYARLVSSKDQVEPLDFMISRYAKEAAKFDDKAKSSKSNEDKEEAEESAAGYRDLSTLFWQHKVRALVGVACQEDAACYVRFLKLTPDALVTELKLPEAAELKQDTKAAYRIAAQERALLELAKLGPKAASALPTLLELAESTERIIRQGVLLAMVQVAKKPCDECTRRLDAVISSQEGQDRLSFLTADTQVVRNYFAGAAAQ